MIDEHFPGIMRDDFADVKGPLGSKSAEPTQMKVLKDFSLTGSDTELLDLVLHLWPGDIHNDFEKVKLKYEQTYRQDKVPLTMREFIVFLGILVGAIQFVARGRSLFRETKRRGLSPHPDFGQYLSEGKFEKIKTVVSWAFSGSDSMGDPWYRFRGGILGFNENRARTIIKSNIKTPDETMIAWEPRTTKTGGLPNISFIKRKPSPLGTELKSVADGRHGVMLFLEIQEGKTAMRTKSYVKALGANAACAMRISLGSI